MSEQDTNPNPRLERSGSRDVSAATAATDASLLARVRENDQRAMAAIFDRYAVMVYSVALRVLKDTGDAEDVMQEIFFQVWKNPGLYEQQRGSLGAWLTVVARNRAIDLIRRRKPTDSADDVVLISKLDLESETARQMTMEKVRGILDGMAVEQQNLLEMAYFEGLSHTEIATRTGDPLGTVKTRIRTALVNLRQALSA
jgi:RNA polymerase sigma-70 factor, ECF subfamily